MPFRPIIYGREGIQDLWNVVENWIIGLCSWVLAVPKPLPWTSAYITSSYRFSIPAHRWESNNHKTRHKFVQISNQKPEVIIVLDCILSVFVVEIISLLFSIAKYIVASGPLHIWLKEREGEKELTNKLCEHIGLWQCGEWTFGKAKQNEQIMHATRAGFCAHCI